jgi:hypothetical protein
MTRQTYAGCAPHRTRFNFVSDHAVLVLLQRKAAREHITGGVSELIRRAIDMDLTMEEHEELEELYMLPIDELLALKG